MATKRRYGRKDLSLVIMEHDLTKNRTFRKGYRAHLWRVSADGKYSHTALCNEDRKIAWAYYFNFHQLAVLQVCEGCVEYLEEHGSQEIRSKIRELNTAPTGNTGANFSK
jgi:hypothetical protein